VTVDTRVPRSAYRFYVPTPGRLIERARARLVRAPIGRRTLDAVLDRYELAPRGRVRILSLGWRNHNVVVDTSAGMKVVKRHRQASDVRAILHEHAVLRHLASFQFPAPRLGSTPGGQTLVTVEGRHFALFDFIEGVNLASCFLSRGTRLRLSEVAGRVLARLHQALDGFSPSGGHELGFTSFSGERARDASWHLRQLDVLTAATRGSSRSSADSGWLAENAARIADDIRGLDVTLREAPLSRVVVHGDFGLHNLMFRREGDATVLDFELARLEWRLVDLAIVLSRVGVAQGRAFLAGYRAVHPIPSEEWRLLPDVWRFYRLCGAIRSWHKFTTLGGDNRLRTARSRVEEADRVSEHRLEPWA
jgi:Ser/Thr protein kinase RdoA (MazF antagonist)